MHPRASARRFLVPLFLVIALLNMAGHAAASHDCCGHRDGSPRAGTTSAGYEPGGQAGDRNGSGIPGDDCACSCCQGVSLTPPASEAHSRVRSGWASTNDADVPPTRPGTEIFHPPLS